MKDVPTQTVVQGEAARNFPIVLHVETVFLEGEVPDTRSSRCLERFQVAVIGLGDLVHATQQLVVQIFKIGAVVRTEALWPDGQRRKISVSTGKGHVGIDPGIVGAELICKAQAGAHLDRVLADHFRQGV